VSAPLDFTGRVVLVGGAGRGIGYACAAAFARRGATSQRTASKPR
jgi:NAD(P)-dependent dehydrogenase (short-subunit alcohol dehydrogenase family)